MRTINVLWAICFIGVAIIGWWEGKHDNYGAYSSRAYGAVGEYYFENEQWQPAYDYLKAATDLNRWHTNTGEFQAKSFAKLGIASCNIGKCCEGQKYFKEALNKFKNKKLMEKIFKIQYEYYKMNPGEFKRCSENLSQF